MSCACAAEPRDRVLPACERSRLSPAAPAALFGVGGSTLHRRRQEVGPHAGSPAPRLDEAAPGKPRDLVAECAAGPAKRTEVRVIGPTVRRAPGRLGPPRE